MIVYRELSSIEVDLGFSAKMLYGLSNNLAKHYHAVNIPKKNGGVRRLFVPDEVLKSVQRAIAEKLLILEPVSPFATAYKLSSSVIKNAYPHVNKKIILKLDIKDFFDCIRYSTLKDKAFPKEKYGENIRILLAMLCYHNDILPQGAPSSPIISNIILYDFDCEIASFCLKRGISYTRYCDDMTFSADTLNKYEVISFVTEKLKQNGFLLNRNKIKTIKSFTCQKVTGVVVNEKLNIEKSYRREIRKEVFFIRKYGIDSHLSKIGCGVSPQKYLNSLMGKINYVLQVCPNNMSLCEHKVYVSKLLKSIKE